MLILRCACQIWIDETFNLYGFEDFFEQTQFRGGEQTHSITAKIPMF